MTQLDHDGAEHFAGAASPIIVRLIDALGMLPAGLAGVRLHHAHGLADLLGDAGAIGQIAARFRGEEVRPVRAVLFNKNADRNWGLGWHQDRTICVQRRRETPGNGPWTTKAGLTHVALHFGIIARMVMLRVHLDDVPPDNAPLLVAPGSHRFGLIPIGEVTGVVADCGIRACLAL